MQEEAPAAPAGFTIADVCREYLNYAKANSSRETLILRTRFLLDFCNGTTKSGKRVHKGYGNLPADQLIGLHVKQWLDAHQWTGSRRMAYQALRRAFHYGQELGMIPEGNTLRYKVGPVRKRKAYFDPATEEAMYATANHALADAIRALIRTGCRPGEVARLERRHIGEEEVEKDGRKVRCMVWRFPPDEHKTGKLTGKARVVYVCSEIAALVKERIKRQSGKHIFLNGRGEPWTSGSLKDAFTHLRRQLAKKGIKLEKDQTLYACRHTFAKRQLGKTTMTTHVLAAQMGNSPQIAWEHYGKDWETKEENTAALLTGID